MIDPRARVVSLDRCCIAASRRVASPRDCLLLSTRPCVSPRCGLCRCCYCVIAGNGPLPSAARRRPRCCGSAVKRQPRKAPPRGRSPSIEDIETKPSCDARGITAANISFGNETFKRFIQNAREEKIIPAPDLRRNARARSRMRRSSRRARRQRSKSRARVLIGCDACHVSRG